MRRIAQGSLVRRHCNIVKVLFWKIFVLLLCSLWYLISRHTSLCYLLLVKFSKKKVPPSDREREWKGREVQSLLLHATGHQFEQLKPVGTRLLTSTLTDWWDETTTWFNLAILRTTFSLSNFLPLNKNHSLVSCKVKSTAAVVMLWKLMRLVVTNPKICH